VSTAAAKRAAKRARRPVYGVLRRMADVETGEIRLAIVAANPIDRALMKDRKYREGDELRLEIKRPRNPKFHRLMHAIGQMLVEHVDGFEGLDGHSAIKRIQRESGVCCEEQTMELPGLGTVTLKVPESLAFDEMDDTRFRELFDGATRYIAERYWPDMTPEALEEMALAMAGER
jgi:hypothetical protein